MSFVFFALFFAGCNQQKEKRVALPELKKSDSFIEYENFVEDLLRQGWDEPEDFDGLRRRAFEIKAALDLKGESFRAKSSLERMLYRAFVQDENSYFMFVHLSLATRSFDLPTEARIRLIRLVYASSYVFDAPKNHPANIRLGISQGQSTAASLLENIYFDSLEDADQVPSRKYAVQALIHYPIKAYDQESLDQSLKNYMNFYMWERDPGIKSLLLQLIRLVDPSAVLPEVKSQIIGTIKFGAGVAKACAQALGGVIDEMFNMYDEPYDLNPVKN